ncbi:DNA-binding transcriptional LysR family regulator [Pantoea alhagi]|uniref:LysR family transcriptional regulator n=1 Tax=Mixta sp. BE291 TaxID=3158787 RepID=UPI00285B18BA|nr:DNA-binding transcriptional LysR family regulator [Pantoea alhagi]
MNVNDLHLFLAVTESDSLAQAARRLNITPMAASRRLAALEQELGRRLIQRTTRSLSLTQEGAEFIPYARTITEAEESAKALFLPAATGAGGLLRITAPSGLGRRHILPLIPDLLSANPEMRIDLQLSDEVVDIVGSGIDIAVRVAPLRDSTLIARKIADNPRVLCASPHYLARCGTPRSVSELAHHNCLRLSSVLQWSFENQGEIESVSVEGRFSASNVDGIRALCVQGLGLAQLAWWDVKDEIAQGLLQEVVLTGVSPQRLSIWAVLPTVRYLPRRVTLFIAALKAAFAEPDNR